MAGTRIVTSANADKADSRAPVKATTLPPFAWTTCEAATQFRLLPLVDNVSRTSPASANPSACCANAVSQETSFATALAIPLIETSEIAGNDPSSFPANSDGNFSAIAGGIAR